MCSIPLSVYCLAISATASPTFLRTSVTVSLVKQVTSFWRIINRCSLVRVEKSSLASFVPGSFLVLVAILRNKTAEKVRVCRQEINKHETRSSCDDSDASISTENQCKDIVSPFSKAILGRLTTAPSAP